MADRLGPDMLTTHIMLYFPTLSQKLCKKKFAFFGENASFRPGAYAVNCSKIYIGKNVVIRPGTMLFASDAEIHIEDHVLIGSSVHVYVSNHEYRQKDKLIIDQGHMEGQSVRLKEGCWIGANVTILPGVEIGKNAVVGAGSVVTKNVPEHCVAAGNPARVVKTI